MPVRNTFRAFRSRNYTLFFSGQSVSLIGTWMQRTGVSWLIYSLTHSTFMLGLTVFAAQFPSFLFSLLGGIASDRYSRYKILLITQTAAMVQAVLLAVLTLTHQYAIWQILSLSVMLGIVNAFDVPARQPLVHEMITDKADLPNALALNSSMVNLARLLGPALSGIVLQKFGAGICFLANALSFVAVLISLVLMKLPPHHPPAVKKKVRSDLAEGFRYLKRTPAISVILIMMMLLSLFALPYDTLLPVFAKVIFKGDAATFGYINSCIGLGAICGTFFLASLKEGRDLKIILLTNTIVFGICLILLSHIRYFPVAMIFAAFAGFGTVGITTVCMTLVQIHADPLMRGRMISYVAMAFFGTLPLGSLLIGFISQQIGAPDTMLLQGISGLVIALVFYNFLRRDQLTRKKKASLENAENIITEKI